MADIENMEKYLFVKSSMVSLKINLVKNIFIFFFAKAELIKIMAYPFLKVFVYGAAAKSRLTLPWIFGKIYFDLFITATGR